MGAGARDGVGVRVRARVSGSMRRWSCALRVSDTWRSETRSA